MRGMYDNYIIVKTIRFRRIENFGLNQKFKERVLESVKLHIDRTVYTQKRSNQWTRNGDTTIT